MSEENKLGRVKKVLFFDEQGEPIGDPASTQLPEDPFHGRMDRSGLQQPPFSLEQLLFLSETHPMHSSALEQKATDVIGHGWIWEARHDDDRSVEKTRDELDAWFRGLSNGEQTMEEQLLIAEQDYHTIGQGMLEVVRDDAGDVRGLFHVPAHTCRFHRDGIRIAQIRGEKIVWFKRWGAPTDMKVNRVTGTLRDDVPEGKEASEMLVIQKRSSRSTWYGVPRYVSAVGWISLALAVRDDNLLFFANRREPRWAVIVSNMEDDPTMEEDLRRAFTVDLKSPHRNILIPITGNGSVKFEKLSSDRMDGSFEKLGQTADAQILVSHRVPPERLGMVKVGNLGGNVAIESSRVYREAVIEPAQAVLASRINRFIEREYKRSDRTNDTATDLGWLWRPKPLDLDDEAEDLRQSVTAFVAGLLRLNEARRRIGEDPLEHDENPDENMEDNPDSEEGDVEMQKSGAPYYGDMFYFELFGNSSAGPGSSEAHPELGTLAAGGMQFPTDDKMDNADAVLRKIDRAIETLLMQEDA